MKAKYRGKCWGCQTRFQVGDEIKNIGGRWYITDCNVCERKDAALDIVHDVEKRMLENHHVLFGYDFTNEHPDCKQTGSPTEFLRAAIACGEVTDHEAKEYEYWWSSGGGHGMSTDLSE